MEGGSVTRMMEEEAAAALVALAKQLMEDYYRAFDANRESLVNLYREESVLTFDGREIKGKEAILAKLTSLPQCHHEIADFMCSPNRSAAAPASVFVRVHGGTWVGGKKEEADGAIIHQTFHLMAAPQGGFYISRQFGMLLDLKKPRTLRLAGSPVSRLKLIGSPSPMSASLFQMLTSASPMSASSASPMSTSLAPLECMPPHFECP
ncbi:hypothetical protein BT93_H2943 [Corymbia citriodora subsp. variegata]|nr:hypothetical protein BT93_H2943 [Corymbia citriodora subsp. variegata]